MSKHFKNYFYPAPFLSKKKMRGDKNNKKRCGVYFLTLLILAGGFLVWGFLRIDFAGKEIESISFRSYLKFEKEKPEIILEFINLDIPFISQAPYAIWDELHDRACEEAAIIMVDYYLNKKELTKEIAEQEVLSMVDWQIKNWGGHFDLSAEQIVELFRGYFGYGNIELVYPHHQKFGVGVYDFKIDDIKNELADGNPIIVPAAGRLLKNPYFTPPGPEYHALVIKGYDDEKSEFIVNDPGTKHGADFRYSYEILQNAVHDFNNGDILNGDKSMIVVK